MSCCDTVVVFPDDIFSEAFILWDVDPFLPGYESFFVFFPEFFFIGKGFFNSLVFCLSGCFDSGEEVAIEGFKGERMLSKPLFFEQNDVFVVFLPLLKIWSSQQNIWFDVRFSLFMK
jgi:hypothetical protein